MRDDFMRSIRSLSRPPMVPLFLAVACLGGGVVQARELSFAQRVEAQRAIERVYYSHQTGATLPFERAVPEDILEQKVRSYLKESLALETYYHSPITGEAL